MKNTIIIEKNTGTNRVIETPHSSYTDNDLAVIRCASLNLNNKNQDTAFYLKQVPHSDSASLDVDWDSGKVFLDDEDCNRIDVDIDYVVDTHELPFHEEVAPDIIPFFKVDSVSINGSDINSLGLSDFLLEQIELRVQEATEWKQENETR